MLQTQLPLWRRTPPDVHHPELPLWLCFKQSACDSSDAADTRWGGIRIYRALLRVVVLVGCVSWAAGWRRAAPCSGQVPPWQNR